MSRKPLLEFFKKRGPGYRRENGQVSFEEKVEKTLNTKFVLDESVQKITQSMSGLDYALIGGHAVDLYSKKRRFTEDIDFLIRPEDLQKFIDILKPEEIRPLTIGGVSTSILGAEVDLVAPNEPWVNAAISSAVMSKLGKVVSKPFLVLMKLWASRGESDDADVIGIIRNMNEAEHNETRNVIRTWLVDHLDDFDTMIELAKLT